MEPTKIDNWIFDPTHDRFINQDKQELFIEPRLSRILSVLIQKKGEIIRREEIIDAVWNDVYVNDESLTKGIFDLRKWLKKNGLYQIEIETIRAIGYRLNIKELQTVEKNTPKSVGKVILKGAFYLLIIMSFLIMLIRAVQYEN